MLVLLGFAALAGILTVLSPCILPVVPLLVGTTGAADRARAAGVIVGFAAAFVAVTVLFASALAAAGLTTDALRPASALILAAFGATLGDPRAGPVAGGRLAGSGPVASIEPARRRPDGPDRRPGPGGRDRPRLGSVRGAADGGHHRGGRHLRPTAQAALVALAYAAGAAVPLVIVGRAGARALHLAGRPERRARAARAFGVLTVAGALLVATGLDIPVESAVAGVLPAGWSNALAGVGSGITDGSPASPSAGSVTVRPGGTNPLATDSSDGRPLPSPLASSLPAEVTLSQLGQAPELTGITAWINSPPLTMAGLRGKVVIVHFWTFACVNCRDVQPYVKAWYQRYASAGLVVIGVHTPELSFERDLSNVRDAVASDGVTFPVAFDPAFATWNAYGNRYWPAFYFVDRRGQIRHVYFGEGDYAGSEQVIRELLAEPG